VTQPDWFRDSVAQRPEPAAVTVTGATVRARCWGPAGPGAVLVHGGGAHARWWDHIGPLLAADRRVVALDLSGHGDSDRRASYSLEEWGDEAVAVAAAGGITGDPIIIGHSMGGWTAYAAGARHPDEVAGVIAIDSPLQVPSPEQFAAETGRAFGPRRHYPSAEAAMSRFRVVPDDPWIKPYVANYVARASIAHDDQGWTWRFDPTVFARHQPAIEMISSVRCRVAMIRAERGMVDAESGRKLQAILGRPAPVIALPLAGHHVMLSEPLLLVVALRALLAEWLLAAD